MKTRVKGNAGILEQGGNSKHLLIGLSQVFSWLE